MLFSGLHGWGWPRRGGVLVIALCAAPMARAEPAKTPSRADAPAAVPTGPSPVAASHAPSGSSSPVPGSAAGPTATPSNPPPASTSPLPSDPTDGDRTALIDQDVAQHPPQMEIPSRDPSHLQTARMKLGGLLDRSVRSLENSEVGRVIDVMTGDDGKPAALELDVGGFMGVGNRRIAVAWSLFDLSRTGQNDPLRVALSAAQVRSAPAMDESGDAQVVTGATPASAAPTTAATASASTPAPVAAPLLAPALPPGPVLATPPATPPVLPPTVSGAVVPSALPAPVGPAGPSTSGAAPPPRPSPGRGHPANHDATVTPRSGDTTTPRNGDRERRF